VLATLVGAGAGLFSVLQGALARTMQHVLFGLPSTARLSALPALPLASLILLPIGGVVLAAFSWATHARKRRLVDAVEANALHGGRMSVPDSLVISGQTMLSNGFGASVGLEAAYAQLGGAIGSVAGRVFNLRRADLRNLVGAGTGAAIAAAFGAPLAGAFYAFEIVIGAYTPTALAPVVAAALAGTLAAQLLGTHPYVIDAVSTTPIETHHYLIYAGLGALCAGIGILLMRAVALVEAGTRRTKLPDWARPAIGGLLLIPVALVSPQVLSAGHGALHADLALGAPLAFIAMIFLAKCAASIVSLGFGFRGGLFFASLFLGTLVGHLFAGSLAAVIGLDVVDPRNAALVGMAALAVAVVGGPMTMAMLVLEATHDFALTGAVLAAALVSSTIVRETFGYSFSTWRLHMRGETIKSARDVGWIKTLTAGRMMRRETQVMPATTTIAEFRRRVPLGATSRTVLTDSEDHYAGIVQTPTAYAEGLDLQSPVAAVAVVIDAALTPAMDIAEVMRSFDASGADELAVLDEDRTVLGILSETFVRRRYAEELEKAQRALFGER
jgi:CIC family chloride channel protein